MCGPLLLAVVWLGYTSSPTISLALCIVPVLLENVSLAVCHGMWLQHNGAPTHFGVLAQQHLNTHFPRNWIGCGSSVLQPLKLLDLNPRTYLFGDTWRNLFTGIDCLTWKTWQKNCMLLWGVLLETFCDKCKPVFHDVWPHVGECTVDTLNTWCCNYCPL
jgi:hypothetical protein